MSHKLASAFDDMPSVTLSTKRLRQILCLHLTEFRKSNRKGLAIILNASMSELKKPFKIGNNVDVNFDDFNTAPVYVCVCV